MKLYLQLMLCSTMLMAFNSDVQRKNIRDGEFDIVCYVSVKKAKKSFKKRMYYWYKSGEIHNSHSDIGGLVLHNSYKKYFRSRQLAETGNFKYGLKQGEWKLWFENGNLKEKGDWKNGLRNGMYFQYNENGSLKLSGSFKNGRKTKRWINHAIKDTTFYYSDTITKTKKTSKFSKFFNTLFKEKNDSTKTKKVKEVKQSKKSKKSKLSQQSK